MTTSTDALVERLRSTAKAMRHGGLTLLADQIDADLTALHERLEAAERERDDWKERQGAWRWAMGEEKATLLERAQTAEERVRELEGALLLALQGIPDSQHPDIGRQFEDRLVWTQIVIADVLGEDDPGNVDMAREGLRALATTTKETPADPWPTLPKEC